MNTRFVYSIGIDLGLTNIRIGIHHPKRTEIIPISENQREMPFYISFTDNGILFGENTKEQSFKNKENTVYDILFLLNRNYSDRDFQNDMLKWPFKIVSDHNDKPKIEVKYNNQIKQFYPEEILSMFFSHLKKIASSCLTPKNKYKKVENALISVPIFLEEKLQCPLKKACKMAEFQNCYVLSRATVTALPTKALVAQNDNSESIMTIHVGGRYFIACINSENAYENSYEIDLGGDAFDRRIVEYFASRFNDKYHCDIHQSENAMNILKSACEKVKKKLSTENAASIFCESIFENNVLNDSISRSTFENINENLFKSMIKHIENVLKNSHLTKENITKVLLVGGSANIPRIQQLIKSYFGHLEVKLSEHPEEDTVLGTADWAHTLKEKDALKEVEILLIDEKVHSFGIGTSDDNNIIFLNTNDQYKGRSYLFTTSKDNQTKVVIKLYEGKRVKSSDNHFLCKFEFDGIQPEPRGVPQIEVTMKICYYYNDTFIKIKVEDKKSCKYEKYIFDYTKVKLSEKEFDLMAAREKEFKKADEEIKNKLKAKFELEKFCFNARNILIENKFALSAQNIIENEISNTLKWSNSNNNLMISDYENKLNEIQNKFIQLFTNIDTKHSFGVIKLMGCLSDE